MKEREHLIEVLKKTKNAILKNDSIELKEQSNRTIHSASIYKDTDNITVAVLIYALSKIIERRNQDIDPQDCQFCKKISLSIDRAIASLQSNNEEEFRKNLKKIITVLEKNSGNLKVYIQDVLRKAKINKASKI